MKLDTVFAPTSLNEIPALARAADDIGFDALWTARDQPRSVLAALPLVAEHSERIKFGTSIAVAFPRSPLVHAQIGWDLAQQIQGSLHPRPRHAGEGSQRAPLQDQMGSAGATPA
jgi:alkanesulfonate monooxygenase SsuD/methylene tetrahydromethanopterin reductase-like flavin-dependent oxidoreductase (luciferase family)